MYILVLCVCLRFVFCYRIARFLRKRPLGGLWTQRVLSVKCTSILKQEEFGVPHKSTDPHVHTGPHVHRPTCPQVYCKTGHGISKFVVYNKPYYLHVVQLKPVRNFEQVSLLAKAYKTTNVTSRNIFDWCMQQSVTGNQSRRDTRSENPVC